MNIWIDKSIELANQRDYLDQLFKVYPLAQNLIREVNKDKWSLVEKYYVDEDKVNLIKTLLSLDLFPIKDSYVPYLKKDKSSVSRNPQTVNRLYGTLKELGLEEIWKRSCAPKETNRQIGPMFKNWIQSGVLGVPILPEREFMESSENCVLGGSDSLLMHFASEHLGYSINKGLDLVAKFGGKYVIGEAKFLTDFGGHQNAQFNDAINLVKDTTAKAIKVAILDGVLYINGRNKMHSYILNEGYNYNILSSLFLREYLFSL